MDAGFFKENRRKLQKGVEDGAPIVIAGNGLLQKTRDDDTYPFHQESNFWYLTGLNEPDLVLVIDDKNEYLIQPKRHERTVIFSGSADSDKLKQISGFNEVLSSEEGWERLTALLKKSKKIVTLMPQPEYDKLYDVYTNPAPRRVSKRIKKSNPSLKLIDIKSYLAKLRSIKTEAEIKAIEKAINHTEKIYIHIAKNFSKYKNENDIYADIINYQLSNNLDLSFEPIIANGKNAVTLHYQANDAKIDRTKITLLDLGYRMNGYCADLTRSISAKPSKRQSEIYEAVKSIQQYAINLLRPGTMPIEYEKSVARFAGEKLRDLGLIKNITGEEVHEFYKHRTSHFLGIDVHDEGNYNQPFQTGMVLTVEPGIYIAKESIGIRIEDDVVITEDGCRNLSKSLSRKIDSITMEAQ